MQFIQKVPFDNPVVLNYVCIGYVIVQLILLVIKKKNNQTPQEEGRLVTTVHNYDLAKTSKFITMMGVMHMYFHFIQSLFIQSLMSLKNIYNTKLIAIHVLSKSTTSELKHLLKILTAIAKVEKCSKKKDEQSSYLPPSSP
ncbi:hypothetical protein BDZ97DRAFT_1901086 [Flammula alnicola]|nr:hypothetical protein BDZ97DRAFT_1901086 [Flammula alnicola]